MFMNAFQCLPRPAVILSGPAQNTPPLTFDIDPALFVLFRSHRLARGVIGAPVPSAIPCMGFYCFHYFIVSRANTRRCVRSIQPIIERGQIPGRVQKQTGNHHRLRNRGGHISGRLKRFIGLRGEAVEVETIVPVRMAD